MAAVTEHRTLTEAAVAEKRRQDARMAGWIGIVLRTGVFCASALVALGLLLVLLGHGGPDTRDQALGKGVDLHPLGIRDFVGGVRDGDGPSVIQLGLMVLILTPTARVALTLVLFVKQRDRLFVGLAAVVLVILLLGFFGIGE